MGKGKRTQGMTDVVIRAEEQVGQIYRCPGGTYWLTEEMCDARQRGGWHTPCRSCSVRTGGVDDPRPLKTKKGK